MALFKRSDIAISHCYVQLLCAISTAMAIVLCYYYCNYYYLQ